LDQLRELKPLPKPHYCYAISGAKIDDSAYRDTMREYARITGSLTVWIEWIKHDQLIRVLEILRRVDGDLVLCGRPWHRKFPGDADPAYVGEQYTQELELFRERFVLIRSWLASYNKHQGTEINVAAVLYDCERFTVSDDPLWNDSVDRRHDEVFNIAVSAFPGALVHWSARGLSPLFTGREAGRLWSVPLYHMPEPSTTAKQLSALSTVAQANAGQMVPWVALGCAYRRAPDGSKSFDYGYNYPISVSRQLGARINGSPNAQPDHTAPWSRVAAVVFWPPPLDDRVGAWWAHFIEYVEGATE
jgi:hypothetical protein